jgi:uncharacterized damage-inducible protein DinB
MNLIDHFRTLHAFEVWANARSLTSLETVPAGNRGTPAFLRASQLLPHNTLARQVWLWRIQERVYDNPKDWFPAWSIEETRARMVDVDAQWTAYLGALTDSELARQNHYSSSEGVRYVSTIHEIITHVFNHSTYHRAQIARIVHESGGQRASTDFIAFSRKQL